MGKVVLNNGVAMPSIIMGTSVADRAGSRRKLTRKMSDSVRFAVRNGIRGFDTAHDYANESILGEVFQSLMKNGEIKREELFLTTKVGNGQQRTGNMREKIDLSLKALQTDYIDLWLLHWPLPGYYIQNWKEVCDIYKSGKVRAIGLANCRERHLQELKEEGVEYLPQVAQIEYHPFRTVAGMREMCRRQKIQIEAYSANCVMLPFVRENEVLNKLAVQYGKTITQIMMRWHVQQGTVPIFSTLSKSHILDNMNIFDFSLSEEDMESIFKLDCDYKFHPESLNCPGY